MIASPVLLGDALAFTNRSRRSIYRFSGRHATVWTRTIKGKLYTNPVVVNDLLVVSGLEMEHYLVTFDAQGKQDWTYDAPKK